MNNMEPEEITVIVYKAIGLPVKKKGRSKFSVIFGVSPKKFRTQLIAEPGGDPVWNEESTFLIENPSHDLAFTVTDKDTILGQISVPLLSLPPALGRKRTQSALEAHKKNSNPQGELVYDAWVTRHKATNIMPRYSSTSLLRFGKSGPLRKLREFLPHRDRSHSENQPGQLSHYNQRRDCQSVSDIPLSINRSSSETSIPLVTQIKASSCSHLDSVSNIPEVTGVSPKEGSVCGGTRLIIRGQNLGLSKEDVVGLNICGANCLGTLQYESSQKLVCTTKAWHACTGHVLVTTQSGGRGLSAVQFTFTEDNTPAMEHMVKTEKNSTRSILDRLTGSDSKILGKDKSKQELLDELRKLRSENQSLREENRNMRLYVDKLVTKVMDNCPQVLQYPI